MNLCQNCGCERHPIAKPGNCQVCHTKLKREQFTKEWTQRLIELNYTIVEFNLMRGIHSKVTVTNKNCGHTFTAHLNNILNQKTICAECGPKKRMKHALKFYVEKYGRTYDLTKWKDYQHKVRMLSGPNYYKDFYRINPLNLKRGRVEIDPDCVHLDHIIPVIYGFKNGLAPEILADAQNLRIVPAKTNLSKKSTLTKEAEKLLLRLTADVTVKSSSEPVMSLSTSRADDIPC